MKTESRRERVIPDLFPATVEVVYSNLGREWIASLFDENGKEVVGVRAPTRADALRALADELEM